MKFDVVLMNPPYSNKQQFLDMQFVKKINDICNSQIVIHPLKRWASKTKLGLSNAESKHLESIDILDANNLFMISTYWKYAGIYKYDNDNEYDKVKVNHNNNVKLLEYDNFNERALYIKTLNFSLKFINIINKYEYLRDKLFKEHKTMVNDQNSFIYEEFDLARGVKRYNIVKNDKIGLHDRRKHYRQWLKDGKYKYCLYKGSYNHDYDEVQEWKGEDPDKLFKGQICWLTNKENVKNNIKYWMECPLFDLWRRYYLSLLSRSNIVSGCAYGEIPALDFDQSESEFKEYVDSLNDFTKEEIKILKDNNIHNANKL